MTKKTLVLVLALLALGTPALLAQTGQDTQQQMDHSAHHAMQSGEAEAADEPMQGDMQAMHEQMMQRHQQMLDEMKQEQAKLDALVEQMQSAQGDAKVDAIAAVLQELVSQHQERMAQRVEMMENVGGMGGMGGMMGHGMAGMHHGGKMMMKGHAGHCGMGDDCPMKGKGMKCDDCPMKDGMKGDCPMHEQCGNCPMHKDMDEKGTMKEGAGMSSDGR